MAFALTCYGFPVRRHRRADGCFQACIKISEDISFLLATDMSRLWVLDLWNRAHGVVIGAGVRLTADQVRRHLRRFAAARDSREASHAAATHDDNR